mmetsp:Transcript_1670/g.4610  ORF Transcript_1670/g.4610 Transcript_1670/m.4610 type:complete len:284 (-) Transcript_1670:191-1042(-)
MVNINTTAIVAAGIAHAVRKRPRVVGLVHIRGGGTLHAFALLNTPADGIPVLPHRYDGEDDVDACVRHDDPRPHRPDAVSLDDRRVVGDRNTKEPKEDGVHHAQFPLHPKAVDDPDDAGEDADREVVDADLQPDAPSTVDDVLVRREYRDQVSSKDVQQDGDDHAENHRQNGDASREQLRPPHILRYRYSHAVGQSHGDAVLAEGRRHDELGGDGVDAEGQHTQRAHHQSQRLPVHPRALREHAPNPQRHVFHHLLIVQRLSPAPQPWPRRCFVWLLPRQDHE